MYNQQRNVNIQVTTLIFSASHIFLIFCCLFASAFSVLYISFLQMLSLIISALQLSILHSFQIFKEQLFLRQKKQYKHRIEKSCIRAVQKSTLTFHLNCRFLYSTYCSMWTHNILKNNYCYQHSMSLVLGSLLNLWKYT